MGEIRNTSSRKLDADDLPTKANDARWWLPQFKEERAKRVQSVAGSLWRNQATARSNLETWERLYGDSPILGLSPSRYGRQKRMTNWNRLSLNVTKSVIDTFVALITDDRTKLSVLTDDGDWDLQESAKNLEMFHDGALSGKTDESMGDSNFYDLSTQLEFDACIAGTAWAYFYINEDDPDDLQMACERVTDDEILVDEDCAKYGRPPYIMRIKWVDRLGLQESYPDLAEDLETASNAQFSDGEYIPEYDRLADQVICIQAWKLGAKDKPGLYVYCAGDVVLDERPYEPSTFPLEPLYVERPRRGIRGPSTCDQMAGIQREINILAQKVQRSHHLLAAGHWLIEEGSVVNTNHMDNQIGSMVRYRGTPPQFFPGGDVPQGVYGQLDRLYQRGYELRGISPMAAQGQMPAGLNQGSGKAMLVHADLTTKRFQPSFRLFQGFFLRAGRQFERLATEISARQPSYGIKGVGPGMMKAVKWANTKMKDFQYDLRVYPTNALASDPEGRIQQVETMANAGWIEPQDAMRLLDFADLKAFSENKNASYNAVMSCISSILSDGVYKTPEPLMDLGSAIREAQNAYLVAWRKKGVPKDRLLMLLKFIEQAKAQMPKPPPPPAPPPMMPPALQPPTNLPGMGGPPPPANMNGAAAPPMPPAA